MLLINFEAFLNTLSKPAMRALVPENISTFTQLVTYSEKKVLSLHGIGKASLSTMRNALKVNNLTFKKNKNRVWDKSIENGKRQ